MRGRPISRFNEVFKQIAPVAPVRAAFMNFSPAAVPPIRYAGVGRKSPPAPGRQEFLENGCNRFVG